MNARLESMQNDEPGSSSPTMVVVRDFNLAKQDNKSFSCLPIPSRNSLKIASQQRNDMATSANTNESNLKQLESAIISLVEQSSMASSSGQTQLALAKAREAIDLFYKLKTLYRKQESEGNTNDKQLHQQPLTTGINLFELEIMLTSNLGERLRESGEFKAACDMYTRLCKHATAYSRLHNQAEAGSILGNAANAGTNADVTSSSAGMSAESSFMLHRFGLNLGNIYFMMQDYQKALKYYRLTLDRLTSIPSGNSYRQLRIKLASNIATALRFSGQQQAAIASLSRLLSDNIKLQNTNQPEVIEKAGLRQTSPQQQVINANHHNKFALNLLLCHYERLDSNSMLSTLKQLIKVPASSHYERLRFNVDRTKLPSSVPVQTDRWSPSPSNHPSAASTTKMSEFKSAIKSGRDKTDRNGRLNPSAESNNRALIRQDHHVFANISMSDDKSNNNFKLIVQDASQLYRSVLSATQGDRLDNLIVDKCNRVSESILMSIKLMLHISTRDKSVSPLNSPMHVCLRLLLSEECYFKQLAYDLQLDLVSNWLLYNKVDKVEEAVKVLSLVDREFLELHQTSQNSTFDLGGKGGQPNGLNPISKYKSSRINNDQFFASLSPQLATNLSLYNISVGKLNKAIYYGEVALANCTKEDSWIHRLHIGTCYMMLQNYALAEQMYIRAQTLAPGNWVVAHNLAKLQCLHMGLSYDQLSPETRSTLNLNDVNLQTLIDNHMYLSSILQSKIQRRRQQIRQSAIDSVLQS